MSTATGNYRFRIYLDQQAAWRWRLIAPNGRRIAASGEAFDSYDNALRAVKLVKRVAATAQITRSRTLRRAV
jgi:uncharacterized protein YegP (UPF0339 family)